MYRYNVKHQITRPTLTKYVKMENKGERIDIRYV